MEHRSHGLRRRLGYHQALPLLQNKTPGKVLNRSLRVPGHQDRLNHDPHDQVRRLRTLRLYFQVHRGLPQAQRNHLSLFYNISSISSMFILSLSFHLRINKIVFLINQILTLL